MKSLSASVLSIPSMSPVSVVFVSVTPLFVSLQLLIFAIAAVPVLVVMVCVISSTSVISGRRSAAVAASVRGVTSQAPSRGGVSVSGLSGVRLQASGSQGVEEEAFVGAVQGTLQPDSRVNGQTFKLGHLSLRS